MNPRRYAVSASSGDGFHFVDRSGEPSRQICNMGLASAERAYLKASAHGVAYLWERQPDGSHSLIARSNSH